MNLLLSIAALIALVLTPTTQSQTFSGAAGSITFPGGTAQCGPTTAAVTTFTLPASTLAPVSPDTQLAWTPNGNQTSDYTIEVRDPSGVTRATWTIGADSKTQVTFAKPDQPAGAWSFVESGLHSSSCSGGTLSGNAGTATGTAAWYQH